MESLSTDRCGHTWPQNHHVEDDPNLQNCCWREVASEDTDYCIWHADPNKIKKSVEDLQKARAEPEILEETNNCYAHQDPREIPSELLCGANLSGVEIGTEISFQNVSLRDAILTGATFKDTDFTYALLTDANLSELTSTGDFTNAKLQGANITDAFLQEVNLTSANLIESDLSNSNIAFANLQEIDLRKADLSGAVLGSQFLNDERNGSDLSNAKLEMANFREASLQDTNLSNARMSLSDFNSANLYQADLTNANVEGSNFTDANLKEANLTEANLESAVLVRTNLFDVNLTNCDTHGATFTDVQINDNTVVRSENQRLKDKSHWWQRGPFAPPQRCGYDPVIFEKKENSNANNEQLGKAADTYQTFEKLARENARPSLQSEMFILRQDMQRKRHWHNGEYFDWSFAWVSRIIFKYGESLGRIFTSAILIILVYGFIYMNFNLINDVNNEFVNDPVDALYFSTLTFTTLGLGDFQPDPTSELARLLVTSQAALGAVLIAVFVFVLGRRAAK